MHSCSGHGACENRMCMCDEGWWGIDCSLSDLTVVDGEDGEDGDGDDEAVGDGGGGVGATREGQSSGGWGRRMQGQHFEVLPGAKAARAAATAAAAVRGGRVGSGGGSAQAGGGRAGEDGGGRLGRADQVASVMAAGRAGGRRATIFQAPMYVLPLPTHWSLQHSYQGAQEPRRGMYQVCIRRAMGRHGVGMRAI